VPNLPPAHHACRGGAVRLQQEQGPGKPICLGHNAAWQADCTAPPLDLAAGDFLRAWRRRRHAGGQQRAHLARPGGLPVPAEQAQLHSAHTIQDHNNNNVNSAPGAIANDLHCRRHNGDQAPARPLRVGDTCQGLAAVGEHGMQRREPGRDDKAAHLDGAGVRAARSREAAVCGDGAAAGGHACGGVKPGAWCLVWGAWLPSGGLHSVGFLSVVWPRAQSADPPVAVCRASLTPLT